jgi:hypothetical protein
LENINYESFSELKNGTLNLTNPFINKLKLCDIKYKTFVMPLFEQDYLINKSEKKISRECNGKFNNLLTFICVFLSLSFVCLFINIISVLFKYINQFTRCIMYR